ncbi:MAG: alpha/beta hydrolase [bacterium]
MSLRAYHERDIVDLRTKRITGGRIRTFELTERKVGEIQTIVIGFHGIACPDTSEHTFFQHLWAAFQLQNNITNQRIHTACSLTFAPYVRGNNRNHASLDSEINVFPDTINRITHIIRNRYKKEEPLKILLVGHSWGALQLLKAPLDQVPKQTTVEAWLLNPYLELHPQVPLVELLENGLLSIGRSIEWALPLAAKLAAEPIITQLLNEAIGSATRDEYQRIMHEADTATTLALLANMFNSAHKHTIPLESEYHWDAIKGIFLGGAEKLVDNKATAALLQRLPKHMRPPIITLSGTHMLPRDQEACTCMAGIIMNPEPYLRGEVINFNNK